MIAQIADERLPSVHNGPEGFSIGETLGGAFQGGGFHGAAMEVARRGPLLMMLIGALALLAGIAVAIWANVKLGLGLAAGGGILIVTGWMFEAHPWLMLLAVLAGLGIAVWYLLDARAASKARAALETIVRGVEAAPNPAATKAAIAQAAAATGTTRTVEDVVTTTKRKARIPKAPKPAADAAT